MSSDLIVVQPWFSALGHPAQSTLNLARAVPRGRVRYFLVSEPEPGTQVSEMARAIAENVPLQTFQPFGKGVRWNTALAVRKLIAGNRYRSDEPPALLFADGDLFVICAAVRLHLLDRFSFVGVVILSGPESASKHILKRFLIRSSLRRGTLRIFLRTPELLDSWQAQFPGFEAMFRLYPALESVMPAGVWANPSAERRASIAGATSSGPIRIGVIGQIRVGKCIPRLIEEAERRPDSISVAVHGPLYEPQPAEFLLKMRSNRLVHPGFLPEAAMLKIAAEQHYLASFLENDKWDLRMESATFWLAVKVGRPVLCFNDGWLGRMVRETGVGLAISSDAPEQGWLEGIPGPNSQEYRNCLESIRRLRSRLTPDALWGELERNLN